MKRKIALLLTVVLLVSSVFVACSKEEEKCEQHVDADLNELCDVCGEAVEYVPTYLPFAGTFNAAYEEDDDESDRIFGKAVAEASLADMQFDGVYGDLVLFINDEAEAGELKAAVLNTETGAIVYSLTQEAEDAKIVYDLVLENVYYEESFIRVSKEDSTDKNKTVYTETIYTALGKEIVSKTSYASIEIDYISHTADYEGGLYLIDNKVYEITDSVATYKFDKGLKSIPESLGHITNKNYYCFDGEELFVYDLECNLVAYYAIPAGCEDVGGIHILSDGNVLIQYVKELPWDAADYALYVDEEKYTFHSIIFNITDSTTKAVELNYVVETVISSAAYPEVFEDYITGEAIKNLAFLNPIVDKAIDYNNEIVANFDDNMFLLHYLGNEIANQDGIVQPLGDNRFIVENKSGKEFLINEKAEMIGEITAVDYYDDDLKLFVMDGKYYDLDLKPVFDENEIEYTFYDYGEDYTIYLDVNTVGEGEEEEEVTTYYVLNGITMKELALPEDAYDVNVNMHYFSYKYVIEAETEEEEDRYFTVYCNKKGEEIYTVETTVGEYSHKYASVSTYGDIAIITETTVSHDDLYNYTYSYAYYIAK